MKDNQEQPQPLTIEKFTSMSLDDKLGIFTGLPVSAQKLLVGVSAFASTVRPDMAIPVSKLTPNEFDEAKQTLVQTPFFSETDQGRLSIADPMKQFINTDLRKIWEEQQKKDKAKNG